jgi:hypothetical protein
MLAACVSFGICASATTFQPHSLKESIVFGLQKPEMTKSMENLLTSFCLPQDALYVAMLLRQLPSSFQDFYDAIEETLERQNELFETLFDTDEAEQHEFFFSPQKLLNNRTLARRIFIEGIAMDKSKPEVKTIVYYGRFFHRERHFPFGSLYDGDKDIAVAMARFFAEKWLGMKLTTSPMSDEEFKLLLEEILFRIPRDIGMDWIESFLANFDPNQDTPDVEMFLRHRRFPYKKIYEMIEEAPERQVGLFNTLFDDKRIDLHGIFFSFEKLLRNLDLAENIFPESVALEKFKPNTKPIIYHGGLPVRALRRQVSSVYRKNPNIVMAMISFIVKKHMGTIEGPRWLDSFMLFITVDHARELFQLLLDHHEMTPEMVEKFVNRRMASYMYHLLDKYIPSDLNMSREELLLRCALLPKQLHGILSDFEERCKNYQPKDNMSDLRAIVLSSGTRQSLSILFSQSCAHHWDTVTAHEMLGYVLEGELSPSVTGEFVAYAIEKGMNLDEWPLEHLPLEKQPGETRLLMWLCKDGVSYLKPEHTVDSSELYSYSLERNKGLLSIHLKLTEPIKTLDDRLITRAADFFIFNAQAALSKYQSSDRVWGTISNEDYPIIMMGTLYALMEGKHLDFSNTKAEMLEGEHTWTWFDESHHHTDYSIHPNVILVENYLRSAEIYNYVHKASPNDEQFKGIIDDIAALSITSSEKKA